MSIGTLEKHLTADEFYDFMQLSEKQDRFCELVRGEIIDAGVPKKLHGVICANIAFFLMLYIRDRGTGYVCTNDSGFITERDPDTVRGIDVAFYDDAASYEEVVEANPKWSSDPPVLAVEVVSPDDRFNRLMKKVNEYLVAGVKQVWVIDPATQDIAIHEPWQQIPVLLEGNEAVIDGGKVLPGLSIKLRDIFGLPQSAGRSEAAPSPTHPQ